MSSANPYRTDLQLDDYLEHDQAADAGSSEPPDLPRYERVPSRQSSATFRAASNGRTASVRTPAPFTASRASPISEDPPARQQSSAGPGDTGTRLVIAIDYGTTYTGLAWSSSQSGTRYRGTVNVLQDWTPSMSNQDKVRSMYAYTAPGEAQWGSDISDDAIAFVNTKLELEPRETRLDELEATLHLVRGTKNLSFEHIRNAGPQPAFTANTPTQIITDYLTKIRECACRADNINVSKLVTTKTPVDIVITVPVGWSYQAKNATFKAFRDASFNKATFPTLETVVLVNEPEAASHFIARELRAKHNGFVEAGACYVLCDAGGGTVDVVSFQVKRCDSLLEVERVTSPRSGRCGSVFIDLQFKLWLRDVIGDDNYSELDPANAQKRIYPGTEPTPNGTWFAAETGPMRELIRRFELQKKTFSHETQVVKLDLSPPLHNLSYGDWVREGELTITSDQMEDLFAPSIDGVVELIEAQVDEVKRQTHRRLKTVFLVGGFGASPYLQQRLKESLDLRRMRMKRPDTAKSWTATVRGAAIYGMERTPLSQVEYMSSLKHSYGINASYGKHFEWLVRKGDLMLRHEVRQVESKPFCIRLESRNRTSKFEIRLYTYLSNEDDEVPTDWEDGQHEVAVVLRAHCDLGKLQDAEQRNDPSWPYPNNGGASTRHQTPTMGPLVCRLQLVGVKLTMSVLMGGVELGQAEMRVDVDGPRSNASYASGMWQDVEE